jgi:hypothetical protein
MPKSSKHTYEVIVGNIGTIYTGTDKDQATRDFELYAYRSKHNIGRGAREPVTMTLDGDEIVKEYLPATKTENDINDWVKNNPAACRRIVERCVKFLYLNREGAPLEEDESFPSGADFIDEFVDAAEASGLLKTIYPNAN